MGEQPKVYAEALVGLLGFGLIRVFEFWDFVFWVVGFGSFGVLGFAGL